MKRKQASDFDQALLDLYDDYAHGRIDRRGFLQAAAKFAVGGLTAEALLSQLDPELCVGPAGSQGRCAHQDGVSRVRIAQRGRQDARLPGSARGVVR